MAHFASENLLGQKNSLVLIPHAWVQWRIIATKDFLWKTLRMNIFCTQSGPQQKEFFIGWALFQFSFSAGSSLHAAPFLEKENDLVHCRYSFPRPRWKKKHFFFQRKINSIFLHLVHTREYIIRVCRPESPWKRRFLLSYSTNVIYIHFKQDIYKSIHTRIWGHYCAETKTTLLGLLVRNLDACDEWWHINRSVIWHKVNSIAIVTWY